MRPPSLFLAAAASYAANCALGASVGLGLVDTRRFRWVHHAVYITTCVLAASAALTPVLRPTHPRAAIATLALAPAAVPLSLIPRISARSRGHVAIALTAAPFFAAAALLSVTPSRKA